MDLQKLLKIVAIVIGVISIFFLGSILSSGDEAIKAGESSGTVNIFMYVSYAVLALTVLIVLLFTVLNLVSNTSGFKNTLVGIVAFVVLSLICYFGFANGVESPLKDGNMLSEKGSKLIGAGLYLFYFLALIAGVIMLGFGIKKMVK
jgi:ABC-type antimicrobial peptide transport system permease subunit